MKILYIVLFLGGQLSFGQVGIGTVNPKSDLHISKINPDGGSVQIDGGIRLEGSATTAGSFGKAGQVLTSTGNTSSAKWTTPGKVGGYFISCGVPNNIAVINKDVPNNSDDDVVNVTKGELLDALNTLPNGGIVLIRTREITAYTSASTYLTVELPSASAVLGKSFVIAFDGPVGSHNLLNHLKDIVIVTKASEIDSSYYLHDLGSVEPKMFIKKFPTNDLVQVSRLNNDSGNQRQILLYNVLVIEALEAKLWSFITPDCSIRNPN